MKLRNKKTGEIVDVESLGHSESLKEKYGYQVALSWRTEYENLSQCKHYESLAELNEDWEDYKPTEPLINDEKVRKAVRAWAEANELSDKLRVINEHFDCCKVLGRCDSRNICLQTKFKTTIAHVNKNQYYTIAELCGEEEE